jgi:hypothetical protein
MKRALEAIYRWRFMVAGIAIVTLILSACKKENDNPVRTPVAGLMAFNLAPDKNAVGFVLSGNNLTNTPLNYTSYTGGYLPVYVGNREVKSYDFNTSTPLATNNQVFVDSMYYSVFTIGNNGNYLNVIVKDPLDSLTPASGQSYIRYINAIADSSASPLVTISSNGTNIISNNAVYSSITGFTSINAGNITIDVKNGTNIAANRTITVEERKAYTILLIGVPGATDSSKAVQIKFIQNATLSQ